MKRETTTSNSKIQTFLNQCRNRTNQQPVEIQIRSGKWKSIGHTLIKSDQASLDWNPQGHRKRSGLETELKKIFKNWREAKTTSKNIMRWKDLVVALCRPMDEEIEK